MDLNQFFIQRWEQELPAFRKVLAALPDGQLDYRPHERSAAAGGLAWQLVIEQQLLAPMLDGQSFGWLQSPRPDTVQEILAGWDAATELVRGKLSQLDATRAEEKVGMLMDGAEVWSDTVSNMTWGFLFDMVHHRGQLSSYLRPMGGKVPAIYGPSADDSGS